MPRPHSTVIRTLRREDLKPICRTLNDPTLQGSGRLRELVKQWWAYKYDLRAMLAANPELSRELTDVAKVTLIPTTDGAQLELRQERSSEGYGDVLKKGYHRRDPLEGKHVADHVTANFHFVALVLNPSRKALGQCSNPECREYFLNKRIRTATKPKYCSSECRGPSETLRKFREARDNKLLLAHQYLYELRHEKDWKRKLATKLDVTPKWVTWAINRGDLPDLKSGGAQKVLQSK